MAEFARWLRVGWCVWLLAPACFLAGVLAGAGIVIGALALAINLTF